MSTQETVGFSVAPYDLTGEMENKASRRFVKCIDNGDRTFTFPTEHDGTPCAHPSKPDDTILHSDGLFTADMTIAILSPTLKEAGVEETDQYLSYDAETKTFTVLNKEDVDKFISL